MTDCKDSSDDHNQGDGSQRSKQVENKKALDTFFPSTWLLVSMVGIVVIFNIIVGMKVFSLQKEKAVIEILKTRYESYEKIIREVEDKEERLRFLTQEIVPLEKRAENAQREATASNERVEKNKDELHKISALKGEVVEKQSAAQTTVAELSNEKHTLRKEKVKLEKLVAELNVDSDRLDQEITEKRKVFRATVENLHAAEMRLKDQEKYIQDVAAANSSFEDIRKQLAKIVTKMDKTQSSAGEKIKDLQEVIAGVAVEKDQLSTQTGHLTNETKKIALTNAALNEEIKGLQAQNKGYKFNVETATSISGQMESITKVIKGMITNIEIDEALVSEHAKALKDNSVKVATASQELQEVIAGVAAEKDRLATQAGNLTNEAKNITLSNTALEEGIKGLQAQNKGYKTEVENVASISGQMESIARTIKGSATNIEIDESLVSENAKVIKGNLGQLTTASQELVQLSKQFTTVVTGVTSQRGKIDAYMKEIAELPDMDAQAIALQKALTQIEEVTQKLSGKISDIQHGFDSRLAGIDLSFDSLEKDFSSLSIKIDVVAQALEKIAIRTTEVKEESQAN